MIINYEKVGIKSLSHSEKTVIDNINEHNEEMATLTIGKLAEKTFTSTSTVSRAIHKCGFESIIELRGKISQNNISPQYNQTNEILEKSFIECTQTIESLNVEDVVKVASYIKRTNKIFVLARGITSFVAEEFATYLELQNYNVVLINDSEVIKHLERLLKPLNVVIVFTAFNSTPEFEIAVSMAKQNNAKVVICSCREHSSLEKYADVQLTGYSIPILKGNKFNLSSRLPLQIISRTIIEYLA